MLITHIDYADEATIDTTLPTEPVTSEINTLSIDDLDAVGGGNAINAFW